MAGTSLTSAALIGRKISILLCHGKIFLLFFLSCQSVPQQHGKDATVLQRFLLGDCEYGKYFWTSKNNKNMKFRTFRILLSRGWRNVLYSVSFFVCSMLSENSSAQAVSDSIIIREDRYQGMRARAYGPQYPKDGKPLIVLDGCIMDVSSVNMQCLDSLMLGKLHVDKENVARLLGLKEHEIKSVSVLKDAAATAIWGTRGTNGVVEVATKKGWAKEIEGKDPGVDKYEWESINDEILKENSKTELNSLPGDGLYIPSDHATYYSIEDFYNNWILK